VGVTGEAGEHGVAPVGAEDAEAVQVLVQLTGGDAAGLELLHFLEKDGDLAGHEVLSI